MVNLQFGHFDLPSHNDTVSMHLKTNNLGVFFVKGMICLN